MVGTNGYATPLNTRGQALLDSQQSSVRSSYYRSAAAPRRTWYQAHSPRNDALPWKDSEWLSHDECNIPTS
ncbi:hypothetical protein BN874_1610002 [Candidatus Contendobacter odensis Run_B_J11]|uniref:Uncharacterized protein n=1 Tax=Candidatus Contendobacter odensis Run_B_J11 TaxID=1400861 RepID=A0A7U7G9D1_9GAMM|nr:hypothetical protein BN874_1610002 [Candidatus Contendobacter odensis Run_B_J11]